MYPSCHPIFLYPFLFFPGLFLCMTHMSFSHCNLMSASSMAVLRTILGLSPADLHRAHFVLVAHQFLLKFSLVREHLKPGLFSFTSSRPHDFPFADPFWVFSPGLPLQWHLYARLHPTTTSFPASSFVYSLSGWYHSPYRYCQLMSICCHIKVCLFSLNSRHLPGTLKWTSSLDAQRRLMSSCLWGSFLVSSQICSVFLSFLHVHSCFWKIPCEILVSRPSLPGHTQESWSLVVACSLDCWHLVLNFSSYCCCLAPLHLSLALQQGPLVFSKLPVPLQPSAALTTAISVTTATTTNSGLRWLMSFISQLSQ